MRGIVKPGRGIGSRLLADESTRRRVSEICGLNVLPGTLNIQLDGPLVRGAGWRYVRSDDIDAGWSRKTGQAGYWLAPVTVNGLAAVCFQADESGYPADQIEVVAAVHLRTALGLSDGDEVEVAIG